MVVIGGNETYFWHDAWLGDCPLSESLPQLFEIYEQQNLTVREMADRKSDVGRRSGSTTTCSLAAYVVMTRTGDATLRLEETSVGEDDHFES